MKVKYKNLLNYKTDYNYKICAIKDVSRPSAVRYIVQVGLKQFYEKSELKQIIKEITEQIKLIKKKYEYEKDMLDNEGGEMYERTPDVIWLYLNPLELIEKNMLTTWVARTLWTTKESSFKEREIMKPRQLGGGDVIDDIEIFWSWGLRDSLREIEDTVKELQEKINKK